jgi:hypothetical protein
MGAGANGAARGAQRTCVVCGLAGTARGGGQQVPGHWRSARRRTREAPSVWQAMAGMPDTHRHLPHDGDASGWQFLAA